MTKKEKELSAIVIGGGFYGATIAIYLAKERGFKNVVVLERESDLMLRASYNNQARVHNGYHYPRSFTTAFRSRVNMPRFIRDWPSTVKKDFTKLYAISRRNSKVTANQFARFCKEIGAKIQTADKALKNLFEERLVEDVFLAEEYVFDATKLASLIKKELKNSGVKIHYSTEAKSVSISKNNILNIEIGSNDKEPEVLDCHYLFNCTYSDLNQLNGDFPGTKTDVKQELTEMALIKVPDILRNIGITIMDGPFFSIMPFPDQDLHTLSHVRYTPHFSWKDEKGLSPTKILTEYDGYTRVNRMIRDVSRYLPGILNMKYVESLFEIKTVLEKNEVDDGRPILFERHLDLPGCYSILGSKIDNIYDVLEKLDSENFMKSSE